MNKKLYRSKTNRWIAGVCGGLGEYFKLDPIIFRLLFLFTGIGFGAYIIMWLLVPENPNQAFPPSQSFDTARIIKLIFIALIVIVVISFLSGLFSTLFRPNDY